MGFDVTKLQAATERIYRLAWGGDLAKLVADLREAGRGWREVADVVEELTGVDVGRQTLLNWYGEREQVPA